MEIFKDQVMLAAFERFNKSAKFEQFIEKVIKKYNSNKYRNKWYNKGIEPPEDLFWFLFYYAKKYGRECNKKEWKQYGNMFSSALFFCNGYYFNKMDGQGSIIRIIKQKCNI